MKVGVVYFTPKPAFVRSDKSATLFGVENFLTGNSIQANSAFFIIPTPLSRDPVPCLIVIPNSASDVTWYDHWPISNTADIPRKAITERDATIYEIAGIQLAKKYWHAFLTFKHKDIAAQMGSFAVTNKKGFDDVFGKRDPRTAQASTRDLRIILFWESAGEQGLTNRSFAESLRKQGVRVSESQLSKIRDEYELPTLNGVLWKRRLGKSR